MNTETMLHAIGQIDEDLVQDLMGTQRKIRRFPIRRIACIAAVMLTAFSAVLVVGAYSGWDYASLFRNYYGLDTENGYDFSNVGVDLNETLVCDGMTVQLGSMLADENTVRFMYDVTFENGIGDSCSYDCRLYAVLHKPDGTTAEPIIIGCDTVEQTENTVRLCTHMIFQPEDGLAGGTLQFRLEEITANAWHENEKQIFTVGEEFSVDMGFLQDVVNCEVVPDPYIQMKLGARLESVCLTPLRLQMEFTRFNKQNQDTEEWVNNCYAIMQDGTQVQLLPFNAWESNTNGYTGITMLGFSLKTPINTQEVTALLLNGTEVPIQ